MSAKRGRGRRTSDRPCTAGWDRVVKMAAVAALGLALSACGGGTGSSSAGAPAAQSAPSSNSSVTSDGSGAAPAGGSTTDPGTSTGTASPSPTGSNPPTASTGNVTINWNPPTENTDGTALTDLAGFKIHYGTASKKYTRTITVSNPGLATYVIADLSPGTYYFAVTAYSSAGTESPLSSEVSTTVN